MMTRLYSPFPINAINLGRSIVYIKGVKWYNFKITIVFLSLKIVFVLANSVDPDEISHHAAFRGVTSI